MKNFYKASGLPETSYQIWTENNIIKVTEPGHPDVFYEIVFTGYNESGYPTGFKSFQSNDPDTTVAQMWYECK